jgi:PhoH-like ATPase
MTGSGASVERKTYVVDTSVLISAPDALQNLTANNTVLIPFPVLQELDRRRTATNGAGYTARSTVRFLDDLQSQASQDELQSGIPLNGGLLKFHNGTLDLDRAWPGFNATYADDAIILAADLYQREHPGEQIILVTRDAAMRCKARARALTAEDYYSDRPVVSPEKFYSGRMRVDVPDAYASLLSTLHHEQRLPVEALKEFTDVSQFRANQCCELQVAGSGKSAWGIYKNHDTPGYLRRVNTKVNERFGPCSPEQFCAREMILDDQTLITSLVGIAGTGKTLIALLSVYEMLRSGRISRIEVYRLNAEAGRDLGFLPGDVAEKMSPWAKPIIDNLDFIMRRVHGNSRWTNQVADHHTDKKDSPHPTVESLLQTGTLEISPINYLRGRSIHDTAIIVDDGQNLTQEDMKLVLTRVGEGSRVILTGDPDQIDRGEINSLSNGLVQVVERFKGQACFAHLTMHEVMRSRVAEMAARLL